MKDLAIECVDDVHANHLWLLEQRVAQETCDMRRMSLHKYIHEIHSKEDIASDSQLSSKIKDTASIPRSTYAAVTYEIVDVNSDTNNGAQSLQIKSMRRMYVLTNVKFSEDLPAMTVTQSRSTATDIATAATSWTHPAIVMTTKIPRENGLPQGSEMTV